jgi:hypothetical protein
MRSVKIMLLGIVIALLGFALLQSDIDAYLLRTLGFISLDTLTTIFPPVAIGLILVGVILAIVGFFLKDAARNPFP